MCIFDLYFNYIYWYFGPMYGKRNEIYLFFIHNGQVMARKGKLEDFGRF